MRNIIRVMHATYIGFHGYAEEWLTDNPDLSKELANKCGYWYFPVSASYSSVMKHGKNILSISWLNKGVAPAYYSYALILQLRNKNSGENVEIQIRDSGNRKWFPDHECVESYSFNLPETLSTGIYDLGMKLSYEAEGYHQTVEVAVSENRIIDDFIQLGVFELE